MFELKKQYNNGGVFNNSIVLIFLKNQKRPHVLYIVFCLGGWFMVAIVD
jgi:hypothetical protein